MTRNKAHSAGHGCAVFKVWRAVAGHLWGFLRASREAAICGVALFLKGNHSSCESAPCS